MSVELLLLDLDGTLMDTAPDMGASLNLLRAEHNLPPLSSDRIRPHVSHGTPALLKLGFGIEPQDARFAEMRTRYLAIYRQNLMQETRLFHGVAEVLDALDAQKLRWGIVTNKPGSLTEPLLELAGLAKRVACLVCGDSIARRKPYPDPLLHAAAHCKVDARACAYVGDAERDVQSAHAAGMLAVVALYGYLGEEDRPDVWKPDHMIKHPSELLAWLVTRPAPRTVAETGT